jgi:hypothetical protein
LSTYCVVYLLIILKRIFGPDCQLSRRCATTLCGATYRIYASCERLEGSPPTVRILGSEALVLSTLDPYLWGTTQDLIAEYKDFVSGKQQNRQPEDFVAYAYGQERSKTWEYPNVGDLLSALIVEKATGSTFPSGHL